MSPWRCCGCGATASGTRRIQNFSSRLLNTKEIADRGLGGGKRLQGHPLASETSCVMSLDDKKRAVFAATYRIGR